jgi:hypothetical protein
MSDTHDEAHTGAIKNPKQFLTSTILAFVLPIFIIIGLVVFVTSGSKPNAGVGNLEMAIAQRIQKVGNVEVRDANRPLRAGEAVYNGRRSQAGRCGRLGSAHQDRLRGSGAVRTQGQGGHGTARRRRLQRHRDRARRGLHGECRGRQVR